MAIKYPIQHSGSLSSVISFSQLLNHGPAAAMVFMYSESGFSKYCSTKTKEKLHPCQSWYWRHLSTSVSFMSLTYSIWHHPSPFILNLKYYLCQSNMHWSDISDNAYELFRLYKIKKKNPKLFFCFVLVCLFLGNLPYARLEQMISLCCLVFSGKNLSVPLLCNARSSMFRYHWYLSVNIFFAQC